MKQIRLYTTILMICIYFAIGYYSLTVKSDRISMNPVLFRIFGILSILYGIFRAYRIYSDYKTTKNNKYEN